MGKLSRPALRTSLAGAACALCACAVGPNFTRPEPPQAPSYTAEPAPGVMAPGAGETEQRLALAKQLSAKWWELFRSPALDEVVTRTLADSPSLAQARATLTSAQEAVSAARGAFFPQVDAGADARRARAAALGRGASSKAGSLYSVGASASYALDVFGGVRRSVEQQSALAEFQRYELAAAWLSLTGNAITESVTIASLRAQIDAVGEVIADDEHNVELVQRQFQAGKVARSDLLLAQTQLASDRAQLPPLRQQLAVSRHALAALAGQLPAQWKPPNFDLEGFELPGELPVSLPSELARQRPDILAAEAQLHAASAAIGVATAALYPSLTLSGSITQEALVAGTLFASGGGTAWALASQLAAPLFHGGTLRAQRRAAVADYQASLARYQQTVVAGFQQVADALRALDHDAELVGAEQQLLDTARESLSIQRVSYKAGKTDLLQLLVSERSYQEARRGLAQAQGQRLQDTAGLFVALGGAWWQAGI